MQKHTTNINVCHLQMLTVALIFYLSKLGLYNQASRFVYIFEYRLKVNDNK